MTKKKQFRVRHVTGFNDLALHLLAVEEKHHGPEMGMRDVDLQDEDEPLGDPDMPEMPFDFGDQ